MPVAVLRSWNLRDKFVSQRIPEEIVQEVLLRADVADVVGEHVLLRKTGENYKGLCPFHDEKTPSFTVSPGKGFFYCFGCQAKGNSAGFLMQHASVSFPEAIQMLASRYGVSIPKAGDTHISDRHKPLYELLRSAATFFRDTLRRDAAGEPGRTFCRQRGISGDLADRFELGFAPPAWSALRQAMVGQGFPEELLVQGGLLIERHEPQHRLYDRFRGRIVFPIHDRTGRPVAFGARALAEGGDHDGPKYLNSPETPIFHKAQTLYGLHLSRQAMRQSQQAIIVEGYTDVLACHRHGVANVVGTLGTALTDRHVAQLRTVVKEAVLVFDGDDAGGKAAERSVGLFLEGGLRVRIATLAASEDPDSFLRSHTGEEFLRCVRNSQSFPAYLIDRANEALELRTPGGRGDFVERIAPLLRKVDNEVERWGHLAFFAEKLAVPLRNLERQIFPQAGGRRRQAAKGQGERLPTREATKQFPEEYDLVRLLYHRPELLTKVDSQTTSADFMDAELGGLYALFLQLAPDGGSEHWFHRLNGKATDRQVELMLRMAMEPPPPAAAGDVQAMKDYYGRMRQRRRGFWLGQVAQQLRDEHDESERRRLLAATDQLAKKRLPSALSDHGAPGGTNGRQPVSIANAGGGPIGNGQE